MFSIHLMLVNSYEHSYFSIAPVWQGCYHGWGITISMILLLRKSVSNTSKECFQIKKRLYLVSWRQLQTSRLPTLCLQNPENELFCFRFFFIKCQQKSSLFHFWRQLQFCRPPPTPCLQETKYELFLFCKHS